jgi:hypothetical protein
MSRTLTFHSIECIFPHRSREVPVIVSLASVGSIMIGSLVIPLSLSPRRNIGWEPLRYTIVCSDALHPRFKTPWLP